MAPEEHQSDADRLNAWMRELGYSGERVARLLGVTPETVSRWRRGRMEVPRYALNYLDTMMMVKGVRDTCERFVDRDFGD